MFFLTILGEKEPPIQSLYWFLLVLGALILPYIKEITFRDISLTLKDGLESQREELEQTRKDLEARIESGINRAMDRVNQVDEEFADIRRELVRGYQIYLTEVLQTDEERYDKVVMLNTMYAKEMDLSVSELKELLRVGGFFQGKSDDTYSMELMQGIKKFQQSQGLVPDGIFGHNSLLKLKAAINISE